MRIYLAHIESTGHVAAFASLKGARASLEADLDGCEPQFTPFDDGSWGVIDGGPDSDGEPIAFITVTDLEP